MKRNLLVHQEIQLFIKKVIKDTCYHNMNKHVHVYLMVQMSTQNVMMYIELIAEAINRCIVIIIFEGSHYMVLATTNQHLPLSAKIHKGGLK